MDLSQKHQARTRSAVAARLMTEASYRDAVRLTVDGVYNAFLNAIAAQTIVAVAAEQRRSAVEDPGGRTELRCLRTPDGRLP